ncbi:protein FANTASTIC FOUR 3-like [Magnolia sinica]|uniref:protein FANTASTIC FOUR 3-like n=1 Tax=Magnolia sinica TaxID=86752 RepID=UPI0026587148|nr:protein FANTASTIC FOUR 3-like [Magnolia sinica]
MSSTVCQGLQSCLEPGLIEQGAQALRLVFPKPHLFKRTESQALSHSDTPEQQCNNKDTYQKDLGTFISVQSLAATSTKECYYQHPLCRSSISVLREKSLLLCTENLGCETGTDFITTQFSPHSSSSGASEIKSPRVRERVKSHHISIQKKEAKFESFPPPLTSITGQACIHMRSHREGGRLVLKAIMLPSIHTFFQAERIDGCLRLRLLNKSSPCLDAGQVGVTDEKGNVAMEAEEEKKEILVTVCLEKRRNGEECMNGYGNDNMDEMGMGKYQRQGRCKEGGHGDKGLLNWEAFWVASS